MKPKLPTYRYQPSLTLTDEGTIEHEVRVVFEEDHSLNNSLIQDLVEFVNPIIEFHKLLYFTSRDGKVWRHRDYFA